MTVQEILSLDPSADIRIGVAKLQQILTTMRTLRDECNALEASVASLINAKHKLEVEIDVLSTDNEFLEAEVTILKDEKCGLAKRYNDTKHELAKLQKAYGELAMVRLRIGAIDITLYDL